MSNFQFLLSDPGFVSFGEVAVAAEKILPIDPAACILNCRRAMEFAIQWMYSVDGDLDMPEQDNLQRLMAPKEFKEIVGPQLWQRMDLIRKKGNTAAHNAGKISRSVAMLCLENLHAFLDFVAYCYTESHEPGVFDPNLVPTDSLPHSLPQQADFARDLARLMEENKQLRKELTARRQAHKQTYVPKPLKLSEYETRKFYIDAMLEDAGWIEGVDWINEAEFPDPLHQDQLLTADYLLCDSKGAPLALVEAGKSGADLSAIRPRGQALAELLEARYHRRPVLFLTNGFETHILDGLSPERSCACIYSKEDLEKLFRLQSFRKALTDITVKESIADRYYQQEAVQAVCEDMEQNHRRKALLVMAPGSGKTRTVIALCDVLLRHGRGERIAYLADRHSLLTQAKRSFERYLPELHSSLLWEERPHSSCIFATYDELSHAIDTWKKGEGKLLTCGYFDLIICDEAHSSVYENYEDLFTYFDAPLIGLTSTPVGEIPHSSFTFFERKTGDPTYSYEPKQAVQDGYLIDFLSVKTDLQFPEAVPTYDSLSTGDRAKCDKALSEDSRNLPEKILSSSMNRWIFRDDIIRQGLSILMKEGKRVQQGKRLGKTILFAKNLDHARKICDIFCQEYPHLPGFAQVIHGQSQEAQALLDAFSDPESLPHIAISPDCLDSGVDIPACMNLVFFKRVVSKTKFRQMIGRGSRPYPGSREGETKDQFYVFDFCGNFSFFRFHDSSSHWGRLSREALLYALLTELMAKLHTSADRSPQYSTLAQALSQRAAAIIQALDRSRFSVRGHLKTVELYSDPSRYHSLSPEELSQIRQELSPLIPEGSMDLGTVTLDLLLCGYQLSYDTGKQKGQLRSALTDLLRSLSALNHLPPIAKEGKLLHKLLHTAYLKTATPIDMEQLRPHLLPLIPHLPQAKLPDPYPILEPMLSHH